jgi:hypothetical protein
MARTTPWCKKPRGSTFAPSRRPTRAEASWNNGASVIELPRLHRRQHAKSTPATPASGRPSNTAIAATQRCLLERQRVKIWLKKYLMNCVSCRYKKPVIC